ncbi:hypothetical protein E4U45_002221, partial [Claviceps purpurea]
KLKPYGINQDADNLAYDPKARETRFQPEVGHWTSGEPYGILRDVVKASVFWEPVIDDGGALERRAAWHGDSGRGCIYPAV